MATPKHLLTFAGPAAWRAWLQKHHASEREAWLLHPKQGSGRKGLNYADALDEALCFGWIDGQLKPIDDGSFALRYSPRRPGSVWSERNKRRVERLIAAGRMAPAGQAAIDAAKANGEWQAASERENVDALPADLAAALAKRGAVSAFAAWSPSHRKQYLYWLAEAKRPATREKRIQAIVERAASRA